MPKICREFQFPSNGKGYLNKGAQNESCCNFHTVSIPFKRERVSQSLSWDMVVLLISGFQFPSNGKGYLNYFSVCKSLGQHTAGFQFPSNGKGYLNGERCP